VVLLSGGLDSTTALAVARSRGFTCHALTVRYGQLHQVELAAAERVAAALGAHHRVVAVELGLLATSALTTPAIAVPKDRSIAEIGAPGDVPPTYVPARNTVLLALALAWAESIGARDLFLGVNVLDASGYPDCRPEFVRAFEALAQVATRTGGFHIHAPLIELTKAQIIALGMTLGVDYALTHSCYDPEPEDEAACGRCDACVLRRKGFTEAGVADPTRYAAAPRPLHPTGP
jgi:7-cyano-7-deazaguanine synthase